MGRFIRLKEFLGVGKNAVVKIIVSDKEFHKPDTPKTVDPCDT